MDPILWVPLGANLLIVSIDSHEMHYVYINAQQGALVYELLFHNFFLEFETSHSTF